MPATLKDDVVQFSLTCGTAIGGICNDTPPDAVYDSEGNDLQPLETLGGVVGYQNWWRPTCYSLAT